MNSPPCLPPPPAGSAAGRFDRAFPSKRLWTDLEFRGRGIASGLLGAALAHAAEGGADTVLLSVWKWRVGAIALYERFDFTVTEPWVGRDQLIRMERAT